MVYIDKCPTCGGLDYPGCCECGRIVGEKVLEQYKDFMKGVAGSVERRKCLLAQVAGVSCIWVGSK